MTSRSGGSSLLTTDSLFAGKLFCNINCCYFSLNCHENKCAIPCMVFKDGDVFHDITLGNSFVGPTETIINLLTWTWVTEANNGEYFAVLGTYQYLSTESKKRTCSDFFHRKNNRQRPFTKLFSQCSI